MDTGTPFSFLFYTLAKSSRDSLLGRPPSQPSAAACPAFPFLTLGRRGQGKATREPSGLQRPASFRLRRVCPSFARLIPCTGWRGRPVPGQIADKREAQKYLEGGGTVLDPPFPHMLTGFRDWAQFLQVGGSDIGELVTTGKLLAREAPS